MYNRKESIIISSHGEIILYLVFCITSSPVPQPDVFLWLMLSAGKMIFIDTE